MYVHCISHASVNTVNIYKSRTFTLRDINILRTPTLDIGINVQIELVIRAGLLGYPNSIIW